MEQKPPKEESLFQNPIGDSSNNTTVAGEEGINSNNNTTESIVTPQQYDYDDHGDNSSSNNNNNTTSTTTTSTTPLLPEESSSQSFPKKETKETCVKEELVVSSTSTSSNISDSSCSSSKKTKKHQQQPNVNDDEKPSQSGRNTNNSNKVVVTDSPQPQQQQNGMSDLSVRVQGALRRILGQNYSDMDPNFHTSPVVNSSLSTTTSTSSSSPSTSSSSSSSSSLSSSSSCPSSSSSSQQQQIVPQKRVPRSDSFCDCYVLGKEKNCQCGEEDSYFDWVWDEDSKSSACHLKLDHREVMFHMDYSCGTAAVRGTVPMRENQHYWEVKMTSTVYGTDMMVGVSTMNIDLNKYRHAFRSLLGRDEDSWGLSYTGVTHHKAQKELYTSKFGQGDIIGIHLDMWLGTMSYYKNRRPLGIAYYGLQGKSLYPVVSSTAARSGMKVVKCRSFPTSLQFICCQALRRYIPPHLDVLQVVDLPPGLRSFLHNKLSWLLQSCAPLTQKNPVTTGKKRPCSEPAGCYEDDDRCKRRCMWEVCPLQGMS